MKRTQLFLWMSIAIFFFCCTAEFRYKRHVKERGPIPQPKFDIDISSLEMIDSLQRRIDTLEQRLEIYDTPLQINDLDLILAMINVESSGNDSAWNETEKAAGCLQIRPVMLREVNRILKMQGLKKRYKLNDRWSRDKSIEMFYVWKDWHHPTCSNEVVARCWNGGSNGYRMPATQHYWNKVQNYLDS